MAAVRQRMAPAARRDQLLNIGAAQFAARPYEDVRMADVAALAGVSRALVYRYFPAKRDLFAAIYQRAADRLLDASGLVPAGDMTGQVIAGLDAHLDYFVANARTVLAANRGALAGDPVIQGIVSAELTALRQRMLEAFGLTGHDRAVASVALQGWLAFVRMACVEWLADPGRGVSRAEVRGMCLRTLAAALGTGTRLPGLAGLGHNAR